MVAATEAIAMQEIAGSFCARSTTKCRPVSAGTPLLIRVLYVVLRNAPQSDDDEVDKRLDSILHSERAVSVSVRLA